jgi:6-phosphogluconolactonase (cycloisomerase 2 family)
MTFFASIGDRLVRYRLDAQGTPHRTAELVLPSPVLYAWPHPRLRVLYVACSTRMFTPRDEGHCLAAVAVPDDDSALELAGGPVPLASRTIHMTLDESGSFVFCLFNDPPGLQVHALALNGSIGLKVEQRADLDLGIYPHQVRVMPGSRHVVVAARGNDARPGRPEDPGALRRFALHGGRLEAAQVVAPRGGVGFGPRHLDFHPWLPCLYVSVERQNQLQVYRHADGVIADEPEQVLDTLAPGKPRHEQFAGAVHMHPDGRFVYVANRDDTHAGRPASRDSGDNTMAVFRVDPRTGLVTPAGHNELGAWHVRTFSLQPPFLVAASLQEVPLAAPGTAREPATLSVFRIGEDGLLAPVAQAPVSTGGTWQFWSGFVRAYGARWG